MHITVKLTLLLTAGIALLLFVQGWLGIDRLIAYHEEEVEDDVTTLARTLSAAVEELLERGGEEAAHGYIERVGARRESTHISLVGPGTAGGPPEVRITRLAGHGIVVEVPHLGAGERSWTLRLERTLPGRAELLWELLPVQLSTTLIMVLAGGVLSYFLGARMVGRHIETLIDQTRRVGDGEHAYNELRTPDELGRLGRCMNKMVDRLASIREEVAEERRRRTSLLKRLRHADRLVTVGRLASSLAHELGTPLNVVLGRATMIARGDVPAEVAEHAGIVTEQARRMERILRQLLDFARRQPTGEEDRDVHDVMEEACRLMEPLAERKGVDLEVRPSDGIAADVDGDKVLQVLTNLLENAIQAEREGGRVTLILGECQVNEPPDARNEAGTYLTLAVADQGAGIPKEDLPAIFEAFFTTKGRGKGTGLGLSVCDEIVRDHGGWIEVRSELGKGSCFTVFLPRRQRS